MGRLDVVVVGAGPAGTACAITARDLGLDVVLCDKATFPRDKTCGDGLTTAALRLLEQLGVPAEALHAQGANVTETIVVSPSGRRVSLPLPEGAAHAVVIERARLDATLVDVARSRGVDVREGAGVTDVVTDTDGTKVQLADGTTLEARFVVAADGHWSTVRRLLAPPSTPNLGEWHAARAYFRGVHDDRLWIVFEPDLLPGYAWVFPLPGGRANVGFGVLRSQGRSGRELKELWPELLARPSIASIVDNGVAEAPVRAWPIPTRYTPDALVAGRAMFAGDAASVVDPMTGEGIAQALETGMLSAHAIARGGDGEEVGARYRRAVDRALGRDLRFAHALQRVLQSPLGARASVRAAGLTPWTRRNFARWLFEDYPRALLVTPDRWRRHMLTGPGAYRASTG
jgi:geranylgeranyl reductase family protein